MGIKRRAKLPPVTVELADILPDDEAYAGYRRELEAEQARLRVKRVGGAEVDRWQRELQRAQIEITRLNLEQRKQTGVEGESPEASDMLREVYREVFMSAFVGLEGFEDVAEGDAAAAWDALYDYMPLLVVLAGAATLKAQRPSDPES